MKIYLDLLPEEQKKEIRRSKIFGKIVKAEISFLLPLVLLAVILFAANLILNIQKASIISENNIRQSQDNYKELKKYEDAFGIANDMSLKVSKVKSEQLLWSKVLKILSSNIPEGVMLESLITKDYQVFIVGKARTRDDLIKLKDLLSKTNCFENVNIPISNLVVKDNVDFQLDFTVQETCVKEKNK